MISGSGPRAHYCPKGSAVALPCPSGRFRNTTGAVNELLCDVCPPGGATVGLNQRRASFSTLSASPPASWDTHSCCDAVCTSGASCATGSTTPKLCSPGSFAPSQGVIECLSCGLGTFVSQPNSTSCNSCLAGSICPEGSSAPLPCASGTYGVATDLSEQSQCLPCPRGWRAIFGLQIVSQPNPNINLPPPPPCPSHPTQVLVFKRVTCTLLSR
jgi:hypothetical protein